METWSVFWYIFKGAMEKVHRLSSYILICLHFVCHIQTSQTPLIALSIKLQKKHLIIKDVFPEPHTGATVLYYISITWIYNTQKLSLRTYYVPDTIVSNFEVGHEFNAWLPHWLIYSGISSQFSKPQILHLQMRIIIVSLS